MIKLIIIICSGLSITACCHVKNQNNYSRDSLKGAKTMKSNASTEFKIHLAGGFEKTNTIEIFIDSKLVYKGRQEIDLNRFSKTGEGQMISSTSNSDQFNLRITIPDRKLDFSSFIDLNHGKIINISIEQNKLKLSQTHELFFQ